MSVKDALELAKKNKVEIVDLKFVDVPGLWQHFSIPANVLDAVTREPYTRDPRYVAQKAEKYLKSTGLADTSYWGPEIEFFIFDSIRFDQNHHEGYYHIDSIEGFWNAGDNSVPNLGYKIRYKEGYFPVPPMDQYQD